MESILTKHLNIGYDEFLIVEDLNIKIPKGKITSIIGPNGCGKSTILKAVGRILKSQKGSVYLNGEEITTMSTKDVAKKMSILPQTPFSPNGLTCSELVAYGRFPHQKGFGKITEEDRKIIKWALSSTNLLDYENREVDTLSGGQRQRVWIAMALAQQSELILLDEPTTYLDFPHQLEILQLLDKLNKEGNSTIVMVLHDLNLASRYSDYIIALKKGRVVKEGTAYEVIVPKVLEEVYNIDAEIIKEPRGNRPVCVTYDLIK